jgi:tRNA(Ile)-lysidine synthase
VSDLAGRFERELDRLGLAPGPVLVAVSGGADSLALLDLVARSPTTGRWPLGVVHVDHGIHPSSGIVREAVENAAARYRLPTEVERLALGPATSETVARRERFRAFHRAIVRFGARWVFLAHTRDDQVETLLMRFFRGSGSAGLRGILPRRGRWIRPLLQMGHDELTRHAARAGFDPWEDPANRDPVHLRSWIRHELLPTIEQRFDRIRTDLILARGEFEEDIAAIDALLEPLGLDPTPEAGGGSVAATPLKDYSSTVGRVLLRALGRRFELALGRAELDRLQALLAQGHSGQRVDLGQGAIGELSFGRLRLVGAPAAPAGSEVTVDGPVGRVEFGSRVIDWQAGPAPTEPLARVSDTTWVTAGSPYRLRAWRPGDVIRPLRGSGTRLVVRCMQEARVPRTLRSDWPVLENAGLVIWVPGVCRSDSRVPDPRTPATRIFVGAI